MVYKENRNKNSSDFSYFQILTKLKEIENYTYNIKKDLEKLDNVKKDIEEIKNIFKLLILITFLFSITIVFIILTIIF